MAIIRVSVVLVVALLSVIASKHAIADTYKYKDKLGIEHIDQLPSSISDKDPSNQNNKAKTTKNPIVEIYSTGWCPWSNKAKAYFTSRGISFSEYDIENDTAARDRKNKLDPKRGVPTVVINGKVINGYNPDAYEKALERGR